MEEDIDKLQKFIDNCKNCKFATCEQCEINWTEVQAIQNLIARYKESQEDYTSVYLKGVYDERDKWKSKVKEKIKEYFMKEDK